MKIRLSEGKLRLRRKLQIAGALCSAILPFGKSLAGQLEYTPVNPLFGGSPLNGSYLLGQASANNFMFTQSPASKQAAAAAAAKSATTQNPVQQFQSQITSSLLSQIAYQVSQEIIGPHAQDSGKFNLNGEIISFSRDGGQVTINIVDSTTGGTTTIQIPVPTF